MLRQEIEENHKQTNQKLILHCVVDFKILQCILAYFYRPLNF